MRACFPFGVAGKLIADRRCSSSRESTDGNGIECAGPGDKTGDIPDMRERLDFTDQSGRGDGDREIQDNDDTFPSKSARLSAS